MKISLFNTYKIVVPIDEYLMEYFQENNIQAEFIVLNKAYRKTQTLGNYNYRLIKLPRIIQKNKLLSQIYYGFRVVIDLIFNKSDLFILFTQPPFFFIVFSFILRLRKKKYFLYVMDVYPDLLFATFSNFPFKNIINRLSSHSYKNASKVIVLGECMKKRIVSRGINIENIILLPNSSHLLVSQKSDTRLIKEKHPELKDKFILLYSGNMGVPHIFTTIKKVAKQFRNKHDKILFVFVGSGKRLDEIKEVIHYNNVILLDSLDDVLFHQITELADCHLITLSPEYTGISVPSKFYSSLAAGKPVLFEGSNECELAKQISHYQIGKVIEPYNINQLSVAILEYYWNPDKKEIHGKKALELYNHNFSKEALKNLYTNTLGKIIHEK